MIPPDIRDLFLGLARHPSFQELLRRLLGPESARGPVAASLSGLTLPAKALYIALLRLFTERPVVVLTAGGRQAEALFDNLTTFHELLATTRSAARPLLLPAFDVLPYRGLAPHSEILELRAIGLWRMARGEAPITVAPAASALYRLESAGFYLNLALTLRTGEEVDMNDVAVHLESVGYQRREPVEMVGEYSIRGGILDVFPADSRQPVRVEFFGDTIESLRRFDPETQRSVTKIPECLLLPLLECPRSATLLDELSDYAPPGTPPGEPFPGWEFFAPLVRPRPDTLLSLTPRALLVLDEPEQIASAADRLWERLREPSVAELQDPAACFLEWGALREQAEQHSHILLRELELVGLPAAGQREPLRIASRPSPAFHGNLPIAVAEVRALVQRGHRVVFLAPSIGALERLADIFAEYALPFQLGLDAGETVPPYLAERAYLAGAGAGVCLLKARLPRGVILPESSVALFGSEDLFDTSELVARPAPTVSRLSAFTSGVTDLKPGDYVVHATHGVGRFHGVREIEHGEQKGDFMLLEYAGDSRLYVPLTRMDLVHKFRGAGESPPPLDRIGGASWERTKSRVKGRMRDMADELLRLYAERRLASGYSFSADSNWQREFEDAFEHAETADQLTAITDIKRDMESAQPMDRLLCGDVGYGKTEVAMRAAFKALGDGKQVAVLAPTTVLCFQHAETFRRRFAAFPVRVEMISRFRSPKEIKDVLADTADGKVDILIGTHRLLSEDVVFRDLGVLIVDEEQRFGVRHKERIKHLRKNIDVLTMSATPIPRTLHMSLLGLRDLSVIETPPKDRLAIHTVVAHFQPELVRTAIEQELARGGQVYYIHNRVETIWQRAAAVQQMLPDCRVAVGHGQMGESALEKVVLGFMRHESDVLVSTTIVENGLDIPLANTIIIENAERYGLSELYQLRGRVGRSNRRAYAYLLVPEDAELSEVARKRLAALREFSDLGAGFKIAALDLEIRGAGNLLGGQQHGHIHVVGFDMYLRLLEQTVQEIRGEAVPLEVRSTISLGLDLRIPSDYIADEQQRLRAYKRIADAGESSQASSVLSELEDRYGAAPEPVHLLLRFSLLKCAAEKLGIETIDRRGGSLNIKFHASAQVDPQRLMELVRASPGAQFTPAGVLRMPAPSAPEPAALLKILADVLLQLSP